MDVSFDGGKYDIAEMPSINAKPIEEILAQHRVRYVLRTHAHGDIVLKHISKRMKMHLDVIRAFRYPNVHELDMEAAIVFPIALADGADDNAIERANTIAVQLQPTMDLYALGCIEFPFLTTVDDLDAFWQALDDVEQEALRQMLTVLTKWDYPVDYSALEIAERFHVEMVSVENIRNPTYEQHLALHAVIDQEHEATRKMYAEMGVKL